MKIKNIELDYGKYIFDKRISKGLTQKEVATGICSVPYLSKLENGKLDPNEETLNLLLERLDIHSNISESIHKITKLLENWYLSIIDRNHIEIENNKEKIDSLIKGIVTSDLLYFYHLINFRYYLYKKDFIALKKSKQYLEEHLSKFQKQIYNYYQYFLGIYYCMQHDYQKGLYQLRVAEGLFKEDNNNDVDLFYHLALTYSNVHNIPMTIYYTNLCLDIFNSSFKFNRVMECQLLLGINYLRLGDFDKAEFNFQQILNASNKLENEDLIGKAYHNLGYLESSRNNSQKSISYFLKSLKYKSKQNESYVNTLIYLSLQYKEANDIENAIFHIDKALKIMSFFHSSRLLFYKVQITKFKILDDDENLLALLEKEVLKYSEEINDKANIHNYYIIAAEIHHKNKMYKKSSKYYRLAYDILYNLHKK